MDRAGLITAAYTQVAALVIGAALGLGVAHLVDGSNAIGAIAGGTVGVIVGFAAIIRSFQDAMHEFDDLELPPAAGDDDGDEQ